MPYRKESDMYPAVCKWLVAFLQGRYRNTEINVYDTSRKSLARLIQEIGFFRNLPEEWQSWDIYVDIVGFARTEKFTALALVECKNEPITLSHLSQTIGYSRIALPHYSIVISPQGPSDSLRSLLITFSRTDVLQYYKEQGKLPRSIAVARWSETAGSIELGSIIAGNDNSWR